MLLQSKVLQAMIPQAIPLKAMLLNPLQSTVPTATAILMVLLHMALLKATILLTTLLSLAMEPTTTLALIPSPMALRSKLTTLLRILPAHIRTRVLQSLILRPQSLPTPMAAPIPNSTGYQPHTRSRLSKTGALHPPRQMRTRQPFRLLLSTLQPLRPLRFQRIGRSLLPLPEPVLSLSSLLRS